MATSVGAGVLVLTDCALGVVRAGPAWSATAALAMIAVASGVALLAGSIALIAGLLLTPLAPFARAVVGGLSLTTAVFLLGRPLLSGAWLSTQSWSWALLPALVVVALGVGHVARTVFQRAATWSRALALGGWGSVLALVFLNGAALVGLYPTLHELWLIFALVLASASAHVTITSRLMRNDGWRPMGACLACLLLPLLCALALHVPQASDEAALVGRVPALAEIARALRSAGVLSTPTVVAEGSILEPWFASAHADTQSVLDQHLPERRKFHLLVLSVDTVRADSVGFLGAKPSPTPVADALARDAVVFERAYTPYPTSNFAYSSLFTGLHARISPAMAAQQESKIAFPVGTTLAERCSTAGMATAAQTAFNAVTAKDERWFGHLRRGFDVYNPFQGEDSATAREVVNGAWPLVEAMATRQSFLWLHVLDPHSPYEAAAFKGAPSGLEQYWGEIANADQELGRIVERLKELKLYDNTIIVWMSDHGEEFGERGGAYHNTTLYEEQTRVPLLMRIPGIGARRISTAVSLADLLPTLLEVLGIHDEQPRTARSLLPLLLGAGPRDGLASAELFRSGGDRLAPAARALWRGSMKYVLRQDTGTEEVFDLVQDPGERENLIGRDAARDQELRKLLAAMDARIDAHHPASGPAFDEDAPARWRERLSAARAALQTGAGSELETLLFDPFGDPRPAALKFLGTNGLVELLREEWRQLERLPELAQAKLIMLAARAGMKTELISCWEQQRGHRMTVALALAWLGDERGKGLLLEALRSGMNAHALLSAGCALARLGEVEAIPWLWIALQSGDWSLVASALDSLGQIPQVVNKVAVFGERMRHSKDIPAAVALRLLAVLKAEDSQDALHVMAHLSQHEDASVRARARTHLGARLGDAQADDEVRRSALEVEADVALENRNPGLAATKYADAWRGGKIYRTRARWLTVLALTQSGAHDEAQQLAAHEAANAPDEWLRPMFQRAVALTDPRIRPLHSVDAQVELLGPTPDVSPLSSFALPVRVTNTGTLAWPGGFGPFAAHLEVRYARSDGTLCDEEIHLPVPLPEQGVLPGESFVAHSIAYRPKNSEGAHPELRFKQRWFREPDGQRIQSLR